MALGKYLCNPEIPSTDHVNVSFNANRLRAFRTLSQKLYTKVKDSNIHASRINRRLSTLRLSVDCLEAYLTSYQI